MKKHSLSYFWILPLLALFSLCSYGIVANKLGIYWDDWAYLWTRLELGYQGLLRHFSFSRPVAGQIHNIAMLITGRDPLVIQLYGLVMRTLCAFSVGWLVWYVWDKSLIKASLAALFFIAYPGFSMQPIAINFSLSFFLMAVLMISFMLSIRTLRCTKHRVVATLAGCVLSAINLFASEYFFMLELLRPFLLWIESCKQSQKAADRLKSTAKGEIPYALVLLAGVCYRLFFNATQTSYYEFSMAEDFKMAPFATLAKWVGTMFTDSWKVLFHAWAQVFSFPRPGEIGQRTFLLYAAISLCLFAAVAGYLLFACRAAETSKRTASIQLILIGVVGLLLAGQPFWLTGTPLSFVFQNSRFTLPFMIGAAFVFCGLFTLIPDWQRGVSVAAALLIGLSAGFHFTVANEYRRDWTLTKDFFWQIKWRIPDLEDDTVLITNVLPIRFSTDNSLTAALNWIYSDDYENERIPLMLYTNTKRENTLSGLQPDEDVFQEYLSGQFFGNTSDAVSINYSAPGCVHVLDPEVDLFNQTIPVIDLGAALLNNYDRIKTDTEYEPLDSVIFGTEPDHGWCWYYESADLARQKGDWSRVAELGYEAFTLSDHPNDPMERIPFIEGFAQVGDWIAATQQTEEAFAVTPVMNDPLCKLWERIEKNTPETEEKTSSVKQIDALLSCEWNH